MPSNKRRTESASVVIVGSGVAGSLVANEFAAQGIKNILVLEAGPKIPMADPGWWFHFVSNGANTSVAPYAECYDQPSDFAATGLNPWNIVGARIMGSGGTTLHWGGWVPRFMPEDFQLKTNTGQGIDWPFTYADLEPWYCQAEQYLGVSGDSTVNNPPRSNPYPYGPAPFPISAAPFISAFESAGISYGHLPVSRYGNATADHGACRTTGTCDYCPVKGRFTGDLPLDALNNFASVTVRLNAAVTQINMSSKQEVSGVTYFDMTTGESVDVDAELVILCNGAFEAPKLLLSSISSYWPSGIGNDNDLVGRFLCASPFFYSSGTMANPNSFEEELGFPSLYSRYYDSPQYQAQGKLFITMNYETPNVDIAALMSQGISSSAIGAATVAPASFQIYGNMSPMSLYQNRVTLMNGTTRFNLPKTLLSTPAAMYDTGVAQQYEQIMQNILIQMGCSKVTSGTYPQRGDHAACTTRMANSPTEGVVDPGFRVFGTENLFVISNSVLPTMPAANPTLTLVAMALRALNGDVPGLGTLMKKLKSKSN